jgi:hypothetical protein
MNSETFQVYKHSGKFGVQGPILSIIAAVTLGIPLGICYTYLIRWIPFIYINFFATLGYGFIFGIVSAYLLKISKVRNSALAFFTGLLVGIIAWYLAWSGFYFSIAEEKKLFYGPTHIIALMKYLYEHGSWGMRHSGPMTGIPLVIVWLAEAGIIIGVATMAAFTKISDTPYCETKQCWLDEEKKIDTLESFSDPEQLAAFKAGDLAPLAQAKPKMPGAQLFGRLRLKHSPKCDIFYTICIQNVTIEHDKNGNPKEKVKDLTKDLMLPHAMFDLIAKFENFATPAPTPAALPLEPEQT